MYLKKKNLKLKNKYPPRGFPFLLKKKNKFFSKKRASSKTTIQLFSILRNTNKILFHHFQILPSFHFFLIKNKLYFFQKYLFAIFSIAFENQQIQRFIYFYLFSKRAEIYYFSTFVQSFKKLSSMNIFLFNFLYVWAKKQHNNNSNYWVFNKYWLFLQPFPYFFCAALPQANKNNFFFSKKKKEHNIFLSAPALFFFRLYFFCCALTPSVSSACGSNKKNNFFCCCRRLKKQKASKRSKKRSGHSRLGGCAKRYRRARLFFLLYRIAHLREELVYFFSGAVVKKKRGNELAEPIRARACVRKAQELRSEKFALHRRRLLRLQCAKAGSALAAGPVLPLRILRLLRRAKPAAEKTKKPGPAPPPRGGKSASPFFQGSENFFFVKKRASSFLSLFQKVIFFRRRPIKKGPFFKEKNRAQNKIFLARSGKLAELIFQVRRGKACGGNTNFLNFFSKFRHRRMRSFFVPFLKVIFFVPLAAGCTKKIEAHKPCGFNQLLQIFLNVYQKKFIYCSKKLTHQNKQKTRLKTWYLKNYKTKACGGIVKINLNKEQKKFNFYCQKLNTATGLFLKYKNLNSAAALKIYFFKQFKLQKGFSQQKINTNYQNLKYQRMLQKNLVRSSKFLSASPLRRIFKTFILSKNNDLTFIQTKKLYKNFIFIRNFLNHA